MTRMALVAEPSSAAGGKLDITVRPDRLEAYLVFKTTGSQSASSQEIAELLQQNRITLDRDGTVRIRQALDELQRGRLPRGGVLIKRGQTAGASRDEAVQWSVSAEPGTEGSALPLYRATAGEEIARIVPAEPGESGLDVFGDPIPAAPPVTLNLAPGAGTKAGEEPHQIMAAENGVGLLEGQEICVVPLVEVDGGEFPASALETPGIVLVRGDVPSGAVIRARSGVWIFGNCGAADIRTGGPLICSGGIAGETGGSCVKIRARQLLKAPRLVRVHAEVQGHIEVESLIQGCELRMIGELQAAGAQLINSKVYVSGSALLGDIGNFSADTQTTVVVGHHHRLKHQLERLQGLQRKIAQAHATIDRQSIATREAVGRQRLLQHELGRMKALVQRHISDIGRQMLEYIDSAIQFRGTIYANSTVSVAGVQGTVNSQFAGPATIATRSVNGNNLLVIESESGRKMVVRTG